ncbi:MAG: hypothetical protein S0880_22680, partial [Actinomycetota bacterium]|nr:hypothetical protein [Actinomycetota bacterium]
MAHDDHPDHRPISESGRGATAADPIDAVLAGEDGDDLAAIATLVADLRTAYVPDQPLRHSPELAAFTRGPSAATAEGATVAGIDRRRRLPAAAAVTAVAGKVLLGGALAAATVGGLHAADVIDVGDLLGLHDAPVGTPASDGDRSPGDDGPGPAPGAPGSTGPNGSADGDTTVPDAPAADEGPGAPSPSAPPAAQPGAIDDGPPVAAPSSTSPTAGPGDAEPATAGSGTTGPTTTTVAGPVNPGGGATPA